MFRSSPDVRQAPRGILRTPGGSGPPSVSSAVSTPSVNPSVRTVISNTSNNSDRSAKSLKSDQRRAELQANDLKAKIDELERANRALDSQISHYQHVFSNAESFEKKNKAMQEVKALREQQLIRERSCMFWLAKTKKKKTCKARCASVAALFACLDHSATVALPPVVSHSFPDARREIEKLRKSLGELNADIQTSKRLLRQNSSNYSIAKFDNLGHRTSPVVRSSSSLNRLLPSGSR